VNTDLGFQHSTEEANKYASTVAQEATERTATKITETFKESHSLKITNTTSETNIHGVDNRTRDKHVIGMYQYLDKIFEAQVFNYGKRLLFDFIVPEPAALLIYLTTQPDDSSASIKKPPKFDVVLSDIHEGNCTLLANKYGASGLDAPPEPTTTVAKAVQTKAEDDDLGWATATLDMLIPEGYEATSASISVLLVSKNTDDEHHTEVRVAFTNHSMLFEDNGVQSASLDSLEGTLSIGIRTFRAPLSVSTITLNCRRTTRAVEEWRLKVHAALKDASDAQQKDYDSKVARAKADAKDAAANATFRHTTTEITNELKRLAIMMFTRQAFEDFDAVSKSSKTKFPILDYVAAEVEDPYIRFFEQAFEWEQMMYNLYPYYWGRVSQWGLRVLLGDDDPTYAEFLKAGAARLVIPVRENFEPAVAHFMETGQVWSGGPVPDVTSPLYVSIITEIKEKTGAPGLEVAVGDPWEVRLPTDLAKLRTTDTLPTWTKNADGTYTPDEL
jgi:hypothetical protein